MRRAKQPDVLLFFTDQQRWDTTGVHGNPMDLTPNFDEMAAEGTHFHNTITCRPVCAPVRSTLQTGLYPTKTGVFKNGKVLADHSPRMADLFSAAGYHTGYIGK